MSPEPAFEVDLRSDTVTRPSPAMRQAMSAAEVGDDVYSEDPTARQLEDESAALLGKEAALFFPSGTQSNQCALMLHVDSGDEVWVAEGAHIATAEQAGPAVLARAHLRTFAAPRGEIDLPALTDAPRYADDDHYPRPRLLCLENTFGAGGGCVLDQAHVEAVAGVARARGLSVHLDGARLWHAAVASRADLAALAAPADTVSVCFSKGLGAPVGSLLAGDAAAIRRARRLRKLLGGGMRQTGVIAAGALHALRSHIPGLLDDHRRAQRLAEGLTDLPGLSVDRSRVETNFVLVECAEQAAPLAGRLAAAGLGCFAFGAHTLRLVTHRDVDDAQIERALEIFAAVAAPRPVVDPPPPTPRRRSR